MLRGGKQGSEGYRGLTAGGCSCHNSKNLHRQAKKRLKNKEKKLWKKEMTLEKEES